MPRPSDDIEIDIHLPQQYVADTGIEVSADGRRTQVEISSIRPQKRTRIVLLQPEELDDELGNWTHVEDADEETVALADTISSLEIQVESDEDSGKRKRYESSDNPMAAWRPHAQFFLDRMMRSHGLCRDAARVPTCGPCGAREVQPFFRCAQCGAYLQCEGCLLKGHQLNPLHRVQVWNGDHWDDTQLFGLGLVFQLGHDGYPCPDPESVRSMVVIDCHGVFTIHFRYCGCRPWDNFSNLDQLLDNGWYPATVVDPGTCATMECLEQFRLLNVVGNINVSDYVGALRRLTDPLLLSTIPDIYKPFGRITRQYSFLQRARRTGWAQMDEGLALVTQGGMAVVCWTCPHPGMNLAKGWDEVDPKYRFLYTLLLALDANFRLKNRIRANERDDPALGPGQAYFVESDAYKEHLRNYVAEKDVSSCIAFAALLQKDTRITTGLRVSGVGGCVCARHGVVQPLGLGDLQKGERYANMDYILLSVLMGVSVLGLAISYDIACQWKVNLRGRAKVISATTPISTDLDKFEVQYGLPVWHAAAHETSCQTENSLSYSQGVGRTDGEGIERTWAVLNPVGFSTKEMGAGARHDQIENKIDHLNFEKNVGEGNMLARKLIIAIAERNKQVANFQEVNSTLHKNLRAEWKQAIKDWEEDKSKPCPYMLSPQNGMNEAAVLQELKAAEAAEAAETRGASTTTPTTAAAFLKAGLQLEEAQRRIKAEVKGVTLVTAERSSQIQELRVSFYKKLRTFEALQTTFMPGVAALRMAAEEGRDADAPPPKAEDVRLWMPSDLTALQRRAACRPGLAASEAKLREGQCVDALKDLRARLHTQRYLILWRNSNAVGQRKSTRSVTLIGQVGDRIGRVADKYRHAREGLIALKGDDHAPQFRELRQEDMSAGLEEESDTASRRKLARLGGKNSRNEPAYSKKGLSWIWTAGGGPQEDDSAALHDSVRVEWSKARARRDRWVEEVLLLREEMRRTLRMLQYIQGQWRERVALRKNARPKLLAGVRAYALRQVAVHSCVALGFHSDWQRSLSAAVKEVVSQDQAVYREILLDGHTTDAMGDLGLEQLEAEEEEEGRVRRAGGPRTRSRATD
ncbi:hypothetical protein FB45DRAFT_736350 [Roridomyces roridus]|uniref:CxC2-like cysteine cluster KDZ transposase-associated domain-containing protein n=1 Tax=Roridomyces roridus TaxID=1738132 RepID=A0AAD7CB71_9AGAR|nr:hypothetical protein FB45DRAFT_736350 [Roridomyces roridus]